MDNWDKRAQATVFIWLAFGIAIGLTGLSNPVNGNTIGLVLIASIAAFLGTTLVWVLGSERFSGLASTEKAKRDARSDPGDARMALLVQLMDEDERKNLKRRLVDELRADGETLPLADLLASQESEQRRSK